MPYKMISSLDSADETIQMKAFEQYFPMVLFVILSQLLIVHEKKTKEITSMKEVWKCDLNYHKMW